MLKKDNVGYDRYTCDTLNNFFSIVNKNIEVSSVTVPSSVKDSETVDYDHDANPEFINFTYDKESDVLTIPYHHQFYEIDSEEQTDTEAEKAKSELGDAYSMIVEKSDGSELFVYTINGTAHARLVKRHISSFHEMCYLNNLWRELDGGSPTNETFVVDNNENPSYGFVSYGLKEGSDSIYIYNLKSYVCKALTYDEILKVFNPIVNPDADVNENGVCDLGNSKKKSDGKFYVVKEKIPNTAKLDAYNVSYDVVIENGVTDKIYIDSVTFDRNVSDTNADDLDNYVLPNFGVSTSAQLKWCLYPLEERSEIDDDHTVKTVVGKSTIEKNGKDAILHFAFPISKDDGTNQIGTVRLSITYKGVPYEIQDDVITNWSLDQTKQSSSLEFKYTSAYEIIDQFQPTDEVGNILENENVSYLIGSPITYNISAEMYTQIATGESLKWSNKPSMLNSDENYNLYENIGGAAFILVNKSRTNCNESHEGYYIALSDNMFVSPSDDYTYNAIDNVKTTTLVYDHNKLGAKGITFDDYDNVMKNRLNFYLDSNYQGSISRIMETSITKFDMSNELYDDTLNLAVFKLNKAATQQDVLKLSYSLHETYNASFGEKRQKSTSASQTAVSYFIENELENSSNVDVFVNPYLSATIKLDGDGSLLGKMRMYGPKLTENLKKFEKKYLSDTYSVARLKNLNYESAITPIRLADQCVSSYQNVMEQAGMSNAILEQVKNDYPLFRTNSSLYQFGTFQQSSKSQRQVIGNTPGKIKRALELVKNDEEYPNIDLLIDAGLSTIYAYSNGPTIVGESNSVLSESEVNDHGLQDEDDIIKQTNFVDTKILRGIEDLRTGQSGLSDEAQKVVEDYMAVQNAFLSFANAQVNGGRGDTFFISDNLRGIFIKGKDTKVSKLFGQRLTNSIYSDDEVINHSWTTSIYYPIKHATSNITSNYISNYAQWFKVQDDNTGEKYWTPASPYVAALMSVTDAASGPWTAAAGTNRGVINGILDYAISPTIVERTDLYNICVNSIPKIPNSGVCVWGIRTMGRKESAFDQNTCRRTFLYLEKIIKRYLRNYIFEKNTTYTRLQIVNDLEPVMENVKNEDGIYSYTVTCDASNNTPEIINNGDMAVEVSAAPTRTAENIILTMVANKYTNKVSSALNE